MAEDQKTAAPQPAQPAQNVMLNYRAKRLLVVHSAQAGQLSSKLTAPDAVLTAEEVASLENIGKPIHIIPGLHSYPRMVWDAIKGHPAIKAIVNNGELEVETKGSLGQELKPGENAQTIAAALPKSLQGLQASKARDLADSVQDLALLESWLNDEQTNGKRGPVIDALTLQVTKIKELDAKFSASGAKK